MRPVGEHFHHALDDATRILSGRAKLEATGRQRREIDQVLDELDQRMAGLLHAGEVVLLLARQPGLAEQVAHAEDAGKRRTDLMADCGEKPRLRLARLLCPPARRFALTRRRGLLGDVARDAVAHEPATCRIAGDHVVPVVKAHAVRCRNPDQIVIGRSLRLEAQAKRRAIEAVDIGVAADLMEYRVGMNDLSVHAAHDREVTQRIVNGREQCRRLGAMPIAIPVRFVACVPAIERPYGFDDEQEHADRACRRYRCGKQVKAGTHADDENETGGDKAEQCQRRLIERMALALDGCFLPVGRRRCLDRERSHRRRVTRPASCPEAGFDPLQQS
ncbi:hypothetical protein D9M72_472900 [compost metagenome]